VSLRERVYRELHPEQKLTLSARLLIGLILIATVVAIAETEPMLTAGRERQFRLLEICFAGMFAVEYGIRIWSAADGPVSRLRYALTPASLIDLVAVIGALLPFVGADVLVLRLLRVVRMIRLAKVGRFSRATAILERAVRSRASQLWVALCLAVFFLIITATIMYWLEGENQPDGFGSIPRALWWSVATMTTVGYGDVVPGTALGKVVGGLIAIGGIVLIAIPTGIMAAAFSDELHWTAKTPPDSDDA
jgi:voltage-gated potassium channel